MQASETAKINECIDRFADAIRQQEEDDRRAIHGLFAVIAGLGLAIMIGIAAIGAWVQFDITEFLKTIS
jgi:hypothetical protein